MNYDMVDHTDFKVFKSQVKLRKSTHCSGCTESFLQAM